MTDKTLKKSWKDIFLDRLRKSPNVSAAAKAAGYSRGHVYLVRDQDPEFAKAWKEALDCGVDGAEGELYRRAVRGVVKKVFYQDRQIDTVREYSDTLLIFLLKSHKPEVYRETTRNEVAGTISTVTMTTAEWKAEQDKRRQQAAQSMSDFEDES